MNKGLLNTPYNALGLKSIHDVELEIFDKKNHHYKFNPINIPIESIMLIKNVMLI